MSTADASLLPVPALTGAPPRILVVRAPYYRDIADGLTSGALGILQQAGATHDVEDVAGALELPQAIRLAVNGKTYFDGYIALGCVLRGETDHYEHVCRTAMAGLMDVALSHALCTGNGLLTVASLDQAIARSGANGHNKGAEAAVAMLMQLDLARRLKAV